MMLTRCMLALKPSTIMQARLLMPTQFRTVMRSQEEKEEEN